MTVSRVLLDKGKKLDWQTPPKLFEELNSKFEFVLDAATSDENPLGTPKFYTEDDNGIYLPWYHTTYCNPPYGTGMVIPWLNKARLEMTNGVTSVFLLPARTGTQWFHKYIWRKRGTDTYFLKGRITFHGSDNTAPFDSMIVVFNGADRDRVILDL